MTFREKLTEQLLAEGASPDQFSINDPKDNVMNLSENGQVYTVWFQTPGGGKYSEQTFDNPGEAVYDFVTRFMPTQVAERLAYQYHDPKLVIYHPDAIGKKDPEQN